MLHLTKANYVVRSHLDSLTVDSGVYIQICEAKAWNILLQADSG